MANENVKKMGAAADMSGVDNTILQVRELLFGEDKRSTDRRLADLDAKIDQLRADMSDRLTSIENLIAQLSADTEKRRLASVRDIGAAIADIGASVQKMGAARNGG
jgi:16S rRNA C1402 (ribose-2'-O) methylase RsmI